MTKLAINDLASSKELDREEMREVAGGKYVDFPSFNVLSPDFFNKVTPITGIAEIPTIQTNNLVQSDLTAAVNGHGINFVSNNKGASQSNSNVIGGVLNPSVF